MTKPETSDGLIDLLQKREPLLPELREHLRMLDMGGGRKMLALQHPLMYQIPYTEELNAYINGAFRMRRKYVETSRKEKRFGAFVFMHEKPYRINAFMKVADEMSDKDYGEILAETIVGTENLWQWKSELTQLLYPANRSFFWRRFLMSAQEKRELKKLADPLTVYRGCRPHNKKGWSWTLDKEKAEWFAKRFSADNGGVVEGFCYKQNVLALFLNRGEKEIFIDPIWVESNWRIQPCQ